MRLRFFRLYNTERAFGVTQQLHLRLSFYGQPPEVNKTDGRTLVELVALGIGGQAEIIERLWRFAPDDCRLPLEQLHSHCAGDIALRTEDIGRQIPV